MACSFYQQYMAAAQWQYQNSLRRARRASRALREGQSEVQPCNGNNGGLQRELFSVSRNRVLPTSQTCCDVAGCGNAVAQTRDPFWPSFARPRWLSCSELYSGRGFLNR